MWFADSRSLVMRSSLVLLLIMISVLHFFAGGDCGVRALRVYPPPNGVVKERETQKDLDDLFQKYFNGRGLGLKRSKETRNGFQQSKRTVPNCPDPLHN
ncbi:hypothetical protein U1Q18_029569 [Sarracenia purpurea var. burkii]